MTYFKSLHDQGNGWCWPLPENCPAALRAIVSNWEQAQMLIVKSVEGLDDEALWHRPAAGIYAIGNILLHLRGSEHQWIGHFLGGRPLVRDRDAEFSATAGKTLSQLLADLQQVHEESRQALAGLSKADLRRQDFAGRFSAEFILHYTAQHFAYHCGQLLTVRRLIEPDFELFT